jgi:hypothetical protein
MKRVKCLSEVPKTPHWAIFEFSTITIPGDERSRTNPGHGYPESTETTVNYTCFTSEEEWKTAIAARMTYCSGGVPNFAAARVTPASIVTNMSVTVT